jgi:hypothetical protein
VLPPSARQGLKETPLPGENGNENNDGDDNP